ncbi:uncharacterized protein VP01_631g1 [Puccinia sorghi]|uniref:non-specific serine/threonine protein kinase n=1 Tax=Puccinia sorghi TaxID=27349 RepID=A0A0L6UH11_9BASI|nr:uncharacterized protein VP01_631g1 [Puccinia sorghi]
MSGGGRWQAGEAPRLMTGRGGGGAWGGNQPRRGPVEQPGIQSHHPAGGPPAVGAMMAPSAAVRGRPGTMGPVWRGGAMRNVITAAAAPRGRGSAAVARPPPTGPAIRHDGVASWRPNGSGHPPRGEASRAYHPNGHGRGAASTEIEIVIHAFVKMDHNKNVHFKPSTEQLSKIAESQFSSTWQQRHAVLSKLAPALLPHSLQQATLDHYHHLKPKTLAQYSLNPLIGFIVERAQQLHPNSLPPNTTEEKLLLRCLRTQIDPEKDFVFLRKLSDGQSGSVFLIKTRLSNLESLNQSNFYILKKVPKRVSQRIQQYSSIQTELSILLLSRSKSEGVQRVPKLHMSFQTKTELNVVLEYSPSGSIADYLATVMPQVLPPEEVLRVWTIDTLAALHWLHQSHLFCHRDIKPSNLIIHHLHAHLLLTDFATAAPLLPASPHLSPPRLFVPRKHRAVIVGTCDYIAPEVLQVHLSQTIATLSHSPVSRPSVIGPSASDDPICPLLDVEDDPASPSGSYGPEVDFWSFGVSLYEVSLFSFCSLKAKIASELFLVTDLFSLGFLFFFFFDETVGVRFDSPSSFPQTSLKKQSDRWFCGLKQNKKIKLNSLILRSQRSEEEEEDGDQERVSQPLQGFLKALVCSRENRIGCGTEGLEEVKAHAWFRGLDWEQVQRIPVPNFTRAPININRLGDSVCIDGTAVTAVVDDPGGFNFSVFFGSSPGLSALKYSKSGGEEEEPLGGGTTPESSMDDEDDEDSKFWGFTYLPSDPDEFNHAQEDYQCRQKLKSSIKRTCAFEGQGESCSAGAGGGQRMSEDRFSTPIKPAWGALAGSSAIQAPQTGLGCRSVRLQTRPDGRQVRMSQMDQLIQLNQLVLSTAKKTRTNPSLIPTHPHLDDPLLLRHMLTTFANSHQLLLRRIDALIARSDRIISRNQKPS